MTATREGSRAGAVKGIDLTALDQELQLCRWKDADLARAAGLSRRTLTNLRNHPARVAPRTLDKIARALCSRHVEDAELALTVGRLLGIGVDG